MAEVLELWGRTVAGSRSQVAPIFLVLVDDLAEEPGHNPDAPNYFFIMRECTSVAINLAPEFFQIELHLIKLLGLATVGFDGRLHHGCGRIAVLGRDTSRAKLRPDLFCMLVAVTQSFADVFAKECEMLLLTALPIDSFEKVRNQGPQKKNDNELNQRLRELKIEFILVWTRDVKADKDGTGYAEQCPERDPRSE